MTRFQAYQWAVIALEGARERGFATDAYEGKRARRWNLLSADEQEAARRWHEGRNRARARQGVCERR